ncbi:hypothetical protein ccbrp13_40570 [Ktedonobacteria bacterium brp13]|nr:hypothetical protein ccbrp13_40570 [Ktedonobacteria bacterium brp13]
MQCPHCHKEGFRSEQGCIYCGYGREQGSRYLQGNSEQKQPINVGSILNGRYRLVKPFKLPSSLFDQGESWEAIDSKGNAQDTVLIRTLQFPREVPSHLYTQVFQKIVQRFVNFNQISGIPRIRDAFQENIAYYLVFEKIEGKTFTELLLQEGNRLPERFVAELGRQITEILVAFSVLQPPFVHGAISPDAIIIGKDGQVCLLYLPFFQANDVPNFYPIPTHLTGYHAPEQAKTQTMERAEAVGPSADLYALTAIMYQALTGQGPHSHRGFIYSPIRRLKPDISQSMEDILMHQLRLSQTQRYTRVIDMRADLTNLINSSYKADEKAIEDKAKKEADLIAARNAHLQQQRKRALTVRLSALAILLVIIVVAIPIILNYTSASNSNLQQLLAQEKQLSKTKNIGLSNGSFAFDIYSGRSDVSQKQQAAQDIQNGSLGAAYNQLNIAITADPTDGEAHIYREDLRVLLSNQSYVSIVVGTNIDNNEIDLDIARNNMQGAFIAQSEINSMHKLPNGLQLLVLIANSGANNNDVGTTAGLITSSVTKAGNPNHIIGVEGWPFSSQTQVAESVMEAAHIPLVAATASSNSLSNSSPYFFRVNPADAQQGAELAVSAISKLGATGVLALADKSDSYSVSLATSFEAVAQQNKIPIFNNYYVDSSENSGSYQVNQYQQLIQQTINAGKDINLIFVAGYDIDAVRLATALGQLISQHPGNPKYANIKILGGDALYTNLLLGNGSGSDAALAANNPQYMQRIYLTSFSQYNEWQISGVAEPAFLSDWAHYYHASITASQNALPPTPDAILTNDAVGVIVDAANLSPNNTTALTGDIIKNNLNKIGKGKIPAYQGVSGRILFDSSGNPVNKAIVLLHVGASGNGNSIQLLGITGTYK